MTENEQRKRPPWWFVLAIVAAVVGIVAITVAVFHD